MNRRQYLEAVGGATIVSAFSGVSTAKDTKMNVITISGTGEPAQYELSVTKALEKSTANGANTNEGDEIDGTTATGEVGTRADSYAYTGTIESLEIDGHARVTFGTDSDTGGGTGSGGGGDEVSKNDSGVFDSTNWPVFGADFDIDPNEGYPHVTNYEHWLDRQVHIEDSFVGSNSGAEYTDNPGWLLDDPEGFANHGSGRRECWDFKLKNLGSLEEGANGDLNHYFQQFGETLVERNMGDSFIRPAAEFDLWHTIHPETEREARLFGEYLQQIAEVLYAIDGGNFEMVWNPANEIDWRSDAYIEGCWPGVEYVDYVGMDIYDRTWAGPYDETPITHKDRKAAWERDHKPLLDWLSGFAKSHGDLPICFPEWGCWARSDSDKAGGDNPYFVRRMYDWMNENNVAWHVYFEVLNKHALYPKNTQLPNASAKFEQLFG